MLEEHLQERTGWGLNSLEHQCLRARRCRISRTTPKNFVFGPLYIWDAFHSPLRF